MGCSPQSSMQFPRQEYWSGLPFHPLGDLPDPGIESAPPASPTLVADSLPMNPLESPSSFTLEVNYRGWRKARWLVHTGVLGSGEGMSVEPRAQDSVSKARGPCKAPRYSCAGCALRNSRCTTSCDDGSSAPTGLEMRQDLEQMVSEEELKRLTNGVQEGKKKTCWDCYSWAPEWRKSW